MRRIKKSLLIFSVFLLLIPQLILADHFPSQDDLEAIFQHYVKENTHTNAGAVLGVIEADGTIKVVSAGQSKRNGVPITEHSVFEIGSITKAFTAIALAKMVEEEKVDLVDPVSKHLPETVTLSGNSKNIRLIDLITHSSGLPTFPTNVSIFNFLKDTANYSADDLYTFLTKYRIRRKVPSKRKYSNVGVGLLGHALANAEETTYANIIKSKILDPLGMTHTGINYNSEMKTLKVQGHNRRGRAAPPIKLGVLAAAGALKSNMTDMLKFLAANLNQSQSPLTASVQETHKARFEFDKKSDIGLAWSITRGSPSITHHTGQTWGFSSYIGFDPEKGVGVVLLSNTNKTSFLDIAPKLLLGKSI